MNINFSSLALAAIAFCWLSLPTFGQEKPRDTVAATERNGQQLIEAAGRRCAAHATISSKLRVRTALMNQSLVGSGEYAQLRSSKGLLLRLELSIQAGGKPTSVKQVCDGHDLWMHWRLGETEQLQHVDLARIEQALAESPAAVQAANPTGTLATGGLPKLLTQLAKNFDFSQVPPRPGILSDEPVWTAVGVWKLDKLALLAPDAVRGAEMVADKVPTHLPHQVVIQCGQSDLFPYKLVYQRWTPQGEQRALVPVVSVEFFQVALGAELDPSQFDYRPQNINVADRTDVYLSQVRGEAGGRKAEVGRRKSETPVGTTVR
jgi:hypothetical protein